MTSKSQIEWTEHSWNPAVGCTKVSAGCKHCYAETMANRLKFMGTKGYENGFRLTLMPDRLEQPLHRKIPTTYFVNSMSDLFQEKIPFDYLDRIMDVINYILFNLCYHFIFFKVVLKLEKLNALEKFTALQIPLALPLLHFLKVSYKDFILQFFRHLFGAIATQKFHVVYRKSFFIKIHPIVIDMSLGIYRYIFYSLSKHQRLMANAIVYFFFIHCFIVLLLNA